MNGSYKHRKNGARFLVRGLVKRPGKARPDQLSNSRLEFHQTTYQKLYPNWSKVWKNGSLGACKLSTCDRISFDSSGTEQEFDFPWEGAIFKAQLLREEQRNHSRGQENKWASAKGV